MLGSKIADEISKQQRCRETASAAIRVLIDDKIAALQSLLATQIPAMFSATTAAAFETSFAVVKSTTGLGPLKLHVDRIQAILDAVDPDTNPWGLLDVPGRGITVCPGIEGGVQGTIEIKSNAGHDGDLSLFVKNLPSSDPGVAGQVWSNSGVLTVSAG
jgi:hypothetical protein